MFEEKRAQYGGENRMYLLKRQQTFNSHFYKVRVLSGKCDERMYKKACSTQYIVSIFLMWVRIRYGQLIIPGDPIKTEQSIQSIFQDFALINSYLFHSVG